VAIGLSKPELEPGSAHAGGGRSAGGWTWADGLRRLQRRGAAFGRQWPDLGKQELAFARAGGGRPGRVPRLSTRPAGVRRNVGRWHFLLARCRRNLANRQPWPGGCECL